ncbi:DUF3072 domain-containing protein [Nocardioides sp. HDW12B]|uniref:DUF3072 domain-containing protein n=1 Tax=Nocardioides sp. HDW12B TaxID=2714939 RepID=UPI00140A3891|nr:DUF3072 domain-containing protein [Nocardioides sp. HDW12B]QIK67102.1 DUF3072 domain-containing protein [Nocardioides sp. HDW12B]
MTESNTHSKSPSADQSTDEPTQHPTEQPTGQSDQPDVLGAGAASPGTTEKDPESWVTGDEPMTGAQRSYLDTLAREAGETLQGDLTKAEASEHIDRLQEATGRGA